MKELVVISGKGGTGKTSLVAALASLNENMVLADCDVDAADLHLILQPDIQEQGEFVGGKVARIDPEKCTECGMCQIVCRFDAVSEDFQVNEIDCEGCGVCVWSCPAKAIEFVPKVSGNWYVSNTRYGTMVHSQLGIAEENSGKLVTFVRRKAQEIARNTQADFILVDGPPGTGCPVIAAIGNADQLLIVTEPTVSAKHDMERVVQLARHFDVPASICINKFDLNLDLTSEIEQFAQKENLPLAGKIPYDNSITEAQMQGKSILEFGTSEIQNSFKAVWKEILEKINH